ncbi:MAG: hypothetical protein K2P20_06200 [Oscillospiraceae bacterium]|nr:hypothetical protein [Oscillospiraceae bacterium]
MPRFRKHRSLVGILFVIALVEFAGLAVTLAAEGAQRGEIARLRQELAARAEEAPPAREEPADEMAPPPLPAEKPKPAGERSAGEILAGTRLIAHGLGAVDGENVLNCLEGFARGYARGLRVFEADLRLTADGQVVLRHDWRAGWQAGVSETEIPTREEFLSKPILDQYTPLSFQDLLRLMEAYPDICIVTDTKFTEAETVRLQFEAMVQDARALGLSYLLDRLVVQIYDPVMYQVVDGVHHFDHYIFTLYTIGFSKTEEEFRERAAFCAENGILGITMPDGWWRGAYAPIAEEYGVKIFLHTVNDPETARILLGGGVTALYSDTLTPRAIGPERWGIKGGIIHEPY